jgi:hypothetical protein
MYRLLFNFLLGALTLLFPVSALAAELMLDDTVAGFGNEIIVTDVDSRQYETVTVIVEPPRGGNGRFQGRVMEETVRVGDDEAVFKLKESATKVAGIYRVFVEDEFGETMASGEFEVFPDVPAEIIIELDRGETLIVDDENSVFVGVFDRYENPLDKRPVLLLSSDGEVRKLDDETGEDGLAEFLVTPDVEYEMKLSAVDLLSERNEDFVLEVEGRLPRSSGTTFRASLLDEYDREREQNDRSNGFIDTFEVLIGDDEPVLRINEPYDITINAEDRDGDIAKGYVGEVVIESSDIDAQVPDSAVQFYASDRGELILPLSLMFGTPGRHTVSVTDLDDTDISSEITVWVVGHESPINPSGIFIESPQNNSVVGVSQITISGQAPAYTNLELFDMSIVENADGQKIATGESDADGAFRFIVDLDSTVPEHELVVRTSEEGPLVESSPLKITIDASAPEIKNITLLPDTVIAGGEFTVSVTSESGEIVSAGIGSSEKTELTEGESDKEGVSIYQGSFTAPDMSGEHTINVVVRDMAGNEVTQSATLSVNSSGFGTVQGVTAQTDDQDILIAWSPVLETLAYRIYFGASPSNLTNHIDTGSASPSVRLTGLTGGQMYYFVVTALGTSGEESKEKSEMVSATPRGSIFDVSLTSQVNGILMQWSGLPNTDIDHYRIKYGVQSGIYTEGRTVNADTTRINLNDLINGITYYIALTAVQSSGMELRDSVELTAVPGLGGQPGLHMSPSDPVPYFQSNGMGGMGGPGISIQQPATSNQHSAARPSATPHSGPSMIIWFGLLALATFGYGCMRFIKRRTIQRQIIYQISCQYGSQ